MSDKSDAVHEVQSAFRDLQRTTNALPEDRMTEVWFGGWSTKDVLAHLAAWAEYAALDLHRVARGHIPCLASFRPEEIDAWNSFFVKPRRQWPLVQVRSESQHCHDEMIAALNALPETMFAPGHVVRGFTQTFAAHYREHTDQVDRWAREGLYARSRA